MIIFYQKFNAFVFINKGYSIHIDKNVAFWWKNGWIKGKIFKIPKVCKMKPLQICSTSKPVEFISSSTSSAHGYEDVGGSSKKLSNLKFPGRIYVLSRIE